MNAQALRRISLATTLAVATLLIGGAIVLKLTNADQYVTVWNLNVYFRTEYFHVPAHMLLYGTLTAGVYGITGGRWRWTLAAVMVVGFVQESAQSLLFGRTMRSGEVFDLGVDLLSASVVLLVLDRMKRRWTASMPHS